MYFCCNTHTVIINSPSDGGKSYLTSVANLSFGQQEAAISLPASLFTHIIDEDNVEIFFAVHNMSTLFPYGGGRNAINDIVVRRQIPNTDMAMQTERQIGSPVLASTVVDSNFTNFDDLSEPVRVVLRLLRDVEVSDL